MTVESIKKPAQTGELRVTAEQIQMLDETLDQMHVNRKMAASFSDLEQQVAALKAELCPPDPKSAD